MSEAPLRQMLRMFCAYLKGASLPIFVGVLLPGEYLVRNYTGKYLGSTPTCMSDCPSLNTLFVFWRIQQVIIAEGSGVSSAAAECLQVIQGQNSDCATGSPETSAEVNGVGQEHINSTGNNEVETVGSADEPEQSQEVVTTKVITTTTTSMEKSTMNQEEGGSRSCGGRECQDGLVCVVIQGAFGCEKPEGVVGHGGNCCGDVMSGGCRPRRVYEGGRGIPGICANELFCNNETGSCDVVTNSNR